jgi:membrane-associated phospholipid phosphatase
MVERHLLGPAAPTLSPWACRPGSVTSRSACTSSTSRSTTGSTSAADHGLVWLGIGALTAAREGDPGVGLRLGAAMGVESALTNGPIKMCFGRVRPELDAPHEPLPYGMHRPITSSFPSGHAASAFTAAVLLADSPWAPAYFALATGIAASLVYVRMHHTSDIVAGAALGVVLGLVARRVLPLH